MNLSKKQARELVAELREVRRAATLERASFEWAGETVSTDGSFAGYEDMTKSPTDYIRHKTRLYRETWIIGPLDSIIEQLELFI